MTKIKYQCEKRKKARTLCNNTPTVDVISRKLRQTVNHCVSLPALTLKTLRGEGRCGRIQEVLEGYEKARWLQVFVCPEGMHSVRVSAEERSWREGA